MQHWHIYRKWNSRLFEELYVAYAEGRAEKNPIDFWYRGELGFFDFYILPLAEKLKECGVFGVSSEEYLQYATNNRNEWERRGEEAVMELRRNLSETGRLLPEDEPPPLTFVRSLFQGQGGLPPKNQQALAPLPGPSPPAAAPATESVVKFQSTEESEVADKDRDDARTGDLLQEEGSETSDAYPSNDTLSSERRPETFGNDVEC